MSIVTDRIKRLLREPLVHFLLIGACVYAGYAFLGEQPEEASPETIRVTAGEVEWMVDAWTSKWGRPPTQRELLGLIRDRIRETAYYREALAMGLDKDDVIIRRRLTQKLEFLTEDLATATAPTDEELRVFFKEHRDQYRTPDLITFTHVFLDPDKRGDATLEDAKTLKAKLVEMGEDAVGKGEPLGDRFMLQNYYPERTQLEVGKLFGNGFAQPLFELEPGKWHGPVLSGYGTHLVFVHSLATAPVPEFAAVAESVKRDWAAQKREEFNNNFADRLLSRYQVIVELKDDEGKIEEITVGMEQQDDDKQAAKDSDQGKAKFVSLDEDDDT
jgi:hypothetical protein